MPVTNEKDLNRQIQDAKEMILMLLEMDDGEKRELNPSCKSFRCRRDESRYSEKRVLDLCKT